MKIKVSKRKVLEKPLPYYELKAVTKKYIYEGLIAAESEERALHIFIKRVQLRYGVDVSKVAEAELCGCAGKGVTKPRAYVARQKRQ